MVREGRASGARYPRIERFDLRQRPLRKGRDPDPLEYVSMISSTVRFAAATVFPEVDLRRGDATRRNASEISSIIRLPILAGFTLSAIVLPDNLSNHTERGNDRIGNVPSANSGFARATRVNPAEQVVRETDQPLR